ncbi:Spx/MgsR family RNA polymerase-binding regulatory protein [Xylophilus sp. Leaf220]|uniref:Spx/MgsR family RNA polymerase-binding regulatory protein n=1 Tax=Xylophilus sp. Leaf220 TaxID=1735686 RepID=UPI0006F80599|nr:Spx/MgsR family RNA polymerase-binding regulatory protein [Xylophilus sp. Leaf220]KQM69038.1 ArsC family transcriptional regulator [Xylophilus sp. Leaf220]
MTLLYGIPNCDTVKKARAWLSDHGVAYRFHDFKKDGVPEAALDRWRAAVGDELLLNRRGTTWRGLDPAAQAAAGTEAGARSLMLSHASVVKRPVVEWPDGRVTVGFDALDWQARIG